MKALLLDATTTKILSMVYSQTQILEQEVYLVEQLGKAHEAMHHLKAAVFVQPTEANFVLLIKELKDPKYLEYHVFFSNIVQPEMLSRLASADEHDLVKQVHEYYADYMAINEDFYQLSAENSLRLSLATRDLEAKPIFDRNVRGILSSLLSFKRRPSQIRYQGSSDLARRVASEVGGAIDSNDVIFDFPRQEGPMLLILDRRDDPITPLLTQWTYQAMVHELLGLNHNRVILKKVVDKKQAVDEYVLSATQDKFFAKHRFSNFGDLGAALKELLDEYQKSSKNNQNISTVAEMQNFMNNYPEFRAKSINVTKHVAIMSELSKLIDTCQLLDISSLEQEIACTNDHAAHKKTLLEKISSKIEATDKLRLAILFIIRYEGYNEMREIKARLMEQPGIDANQVSRLDAIIEYAGESKRAPGLFTQGSITAKFSQVFSQTIQVANVYTQHQPLLQTILDSIAKGKFKESSFPLVSTSTSNRPSDIFVYIVGGVTYEEAAKVAEFNASNHSMRVVLGGSCIHNSTSFLNEVSRHFGNTSTI